MKRTHLKIAKVIDSNVQGSCPLTLESRVYMTHHKKSNSGVLYEDVFKSEVVCVKKEFVFMGAVYENAVNNQRARENKRQNFKAFELPWGQWFDGSHIIISHNGKLYLRYYAKMPITYKYSKKSYQFEDGTELTKNQLNSFFNDFNTPKVRDSGRQKLVKAIVPRMVCFENIIRMKFNKIVVENG